MSKVSTKFCAVKSLDVLNILHRCLTYALFTSALFCGLASAESIYGQVIGISDGDTVTVLDGNHVQHKIRLSGIDAPEKKQPFGERSKQHLAELVFRKNVEVKWYKKDRYGRVIGKILLRGDDICLQQIRAGYAWHYKAYEREQSEIDRRNYSLAEDIARNKDAGLWSDRSPMPPWEFRKISRRN